MRSDSSSRSTGYRNIDVMGRVRRIHFVGIGGSGMSGIAEVLLTLGYEVSGSDLRENTQTRRLAKLGAKITFGHTPEAVQGADVLVVSTAIDRNNCELVAARQQHIPIVPRADMLAELMRFRFGIAVAGTHGKTTTTSLIASLLSAGGLDPTYVIGGRLNSSSAYARLGHGQYLVAEADESDASFLVLQPMMAVVTNIDVEHMSTYQGDFGRLKMTFLDFLRRLPFYGLAVMCIDDPVIRELIDQVACPVMSYGTSSDADVRAVDIVQSERVTRFTVVLRSGERFPITLSMPGHHNVLNALAALAVALETGVSISAAQSCLESFAGVSRRFECYDDVKCGAHRVTLVDDYGHHPREIDATLQAARAAWPDRRLVLAFQPHRYSRTFEMLDDFAMVLNKVDRLVMTEVFAAGEAPIVGADGRSLARAVRARGGVEPVFVEEVTTLPEVLSKIVQPDDVVLMMGAGSIGRVIKSMVTAEEEGRE